MGLLDRIRNLFSQRRATPPPPYGPNQQSWKAGQGGPPPHGNGPHGGPHGGPQNGNGPHAGPRR